MNIVGLLKDILLFVVLILLQVLLLNRIALFGIAVPVLYIYYLVKLPIDSNRFYVIISAFLMGFIIDIFLNTPGMNAAATTIVATFRPQILNLFYSKIEYEGHRPGIYDFTAAFIKFVIVIVVLHLIILFFIETITLFNITTTLLRIGSSSLLTILMIFIVDALFTRKEITVG